jgi:hypothetical protein
MNNRVSYEELYVLLNEVGVARPVGVDAVYFPLPANEETRQRLLDVGHSQLADLSTETGQTLVQIIAATTAVCHAIVRKDSTPDQNRWYFTNGTAIVRLTVESEGQFAYVSIPNKEDMLADLAQFIPLQPAPDSLNYRVKMGQEDFLALRDLASEWNEVPALEILEADGLDQVAARDLFDSAVEPEWRAIVTFLGCQNQTVTGQATVRALQGAEISWVIRPSTDGKLIAETALPGRLHHALSTTWEATLEAVNE